MHARIKLGLLAGSLGVTLGVSALAQVPGAAPAPTPVGDGPTIQIEGNLKFIEVSDLSALREGVIKQVEFTVGDLVEKDQKIAFLHDDYARLKVQRQKVAAESVGGIERATAMLRSETVQMEIKKALEMQRQGTVPIEEMRIKEAQVEAAKAELRAAIEARELARAEMELADQELSEHTIVAPFTGYVMDRMKDPGEAVQLNEPVVRLGRIDKMQCLGKMPLDRAAQVQVGDLVEVQPFFKEADLDIEKLKFQGKIKNIGREVDSVGIGPPRVQIMAEIDNPYAADRSAGINMQLLDNMEAMVTIYLRPSADRPRTASAAAAGAQAPAR